MPRNRWTLPAIKRLHARYLASPEASLASLGAEFGISPQAIAYLFRRSGLPGRGLESCGNVGAHIDRIRRRDEQSAAALELRRQGLGTRAIAKRLGITERSARQALNRLDRLGVPWRLAELFPAVETP